jgi:hypothetical protein
MIAHPFDIGDRFYISGELAKEPSFVHLLEESSFPGSDFRITAGFHGEMKDNLLTRSVSLQSKLLGIRCKGQDGEGERKIPMEEFLRNVVLSPEVVDHDSDLGSKTGFKSQWLGEDEGELMGGPILNLYLQLE